MPCRETTEERVECEHASQLARKTCILLESLEKIQFIDKQANNGRRWVRYAHSCTTPGQGRLHAQGPSLQNIPDDLRRILAGGIYHDIRIVNAMPSIWAELARELGVEAPALRHYVDHHEEVLEDLETSHGVPKHVAKVLVQHICSFGSYYQVVKEECDATKTQQKKRKGRDAESSDDEGDSDDEDDSEEDDDETNIDVVQPRIGKRKAKRARNERNDTSDEKESESVDDFDSACASDDGEDTHLHVGNLRDDLKAELMKVNVSPRPINQPELTAAETLLRQISSLREHGRSK